MTVTEMFERKTVISRAHLRQLFALCAFGVSGKEIVYAYSDYNNVEEAEEPVGRYWLKGVRCAGSEGRLVECNLGAGFLENNSGCDFQPHRLHVACRQFPVVEALEAVVTPGAGMFLRPFSLNFDRFTL